MTPGGQRWTRKRPTEPGWYWWRGHEESGIALVAPPDKPMPWHTDDHSARVTIIYNTGGMSAARVNNLECEWQGPLTPNEATE